MRKTTSESSENRSFQDSSLMLKIATCVRKDSVFYPYPPLALDMCYSRRPLSLVIICIPTLAQEVYHICPTSRTLPNSPSFSCQLCTTTAHELIFHKHLSTREAKRKEEKKTALNSVLERRGDIFFSTKKTDMKDLDTRPPPFSFLSKTTSILLIIAHSNPSFSLSVRPSFFSYHRHRCSSVNLEHRCKVSINSPDATPKSTQLSSTASMPPSHPPVE